VIIIAAYAEPWLRSCLMMIPAFDHGTRLGRVFPCDGTFADGRPVSEVTRTVMLPFPASGWRTK
jgi:hypothetical protein